MIIEECGGSGIFAVGTNGTLDDCQVKQCKGNGIYCGVDSTINILVLDNDNNRVVFANVRGGSSGCFGLHAANSSSVIHIQAPKNVICDWLAHTGGENFGGKGEIRVDVEGDVHVIREAQEQGEDDY